MNDDTLSWIMLYSSIVGIAHHPRQLENGKPSLTPDEAAKATDEYMAPFRERLNDGRLG